MTGRFEGFIIDVATPTNALGLVNNDVYRNSVCSAVFVFDTVSIIIALINEGVRIGVRLLITGPLPFGKGMKVGARNNISKSKWSSDGWCMRWYCYKTTIDYRK